MLKKYSLLFAGLLLLGVAQGQKPERYTATDIHEAIQKLNFLGSALYVAAHPDDENTRLIAYLANEVKANTAYLSLTRGDGGQNLIGPEIREQLGVIRTQELLGARSVDGGNQLFSRANDFGYSKHPDETFKIWDKEEVLSDVVWAIRKWQPDVIVNRFDHRSPGRTHGHHTGSAMLSVEAFDMTGDASVFPEQLEYVDTWQPRRLFFNTSWWFYGSREKFAKADKSTMLSVDIGVYYPMQGKSNSEIAAEARSMHKCQGFGSTGTRGSQQEFLELIKGDMPGEKLDLFEGINTTWSRLKGGAPIGKLLDKVIQEFDFSYPAASVSDLAKAYQLMEQLEDGYWKRVKMAEVKDIIKACMALYLEAVADDYSATPGEEIELSIEVINRSAIAAELKEVHYRPMGIDTSYNLTLDNNQKYQFFRTVNLPEDLAYTNPYWLNQDWRLGMYTVEEQTMRGLPETPRAMQVGFDLVIDGVPISYTTDVVFKRNDPVDGEVYRPFEVTPPIFANLEESVFVFADNAPQTINVLLKAGAPNVSGEAALKVAKGWKVSPARIPFELKLKGEEQQVQFELFPPKGQSEGMISPEVTVGENTYNKEVVVIEYDHIPTQTVMLESKAKVVKVDLLTAGRKIGYIMGAGDAIPESLEQIGYEVTLLDDKDINPENLATFDAIILGVRAYNTVDRLKFHQPKLMQYVENGGTMIVQYNTSFRLKVPMDEIGPYPLKLSRDRVTVEEAEVRFLQPEHPVLNYPNKITSKDFEGWKQERGLYFPNEWDDRYTPIFSANDPGETPKDGGLLVAQYGKGHYVYTGYSWFRELPPGVPGAFRIFANLIALGKENKR
ncbi:MAG: PIG-L family deacetylase [Bacteroidota bacterium]